MENTNLMIVVNVLKASFEIKLFGSNNKMTIKVQMKFENPIFLLANALNVAMFCRC